MAVFICEVCGATLKKQQVDKHCETKCRNAWNFTCVECMTTFGGFDYKEHNQCMTEVEKYQGKFLEKQRNEKAKQKQEGKIDKTLKTETKPDEDTKKEKKNTKKDKSGENTEETKGEEIDSAKLRKFLEDGCTWQGLEKTALLILKKEKSYSMKKKALAKVISQVFRLSEDFESDSDSDSDESNNGEKDADQQFADSKYVAKQLKK